MADSFDPYYKWLGISPQEQPPNHYRLLGINLYENDLDVIDAAADRQMAHLRGYQTGPHSAASQKLLNECSAARIALLNADKKAEYDRQLREKLASVANAMRDVPGVSSGNPMHGDPGVSVGNALRGIPGASVGNALRGIPGAGEGSGSRIQGSATEGPGKPAAALPRAKALPPTQPPAEAAPLIDVGGSPSGGRPAARRRKARPAWQLPAAGAAAVVLLALVGWMASRPAKSPHENQPPQAADVRAVSRGPKPVSAPPESPRPSAAAAAKPAAPVPPTPADPPTVEPPLTLVADASHRPETPGVVADRIVVWNLQMKDQGTRELNVCLLRDEREVWRRDAIEIPWSPETVESAAIEIPPLRFDRVRVEITKWEQVRGGLAEIEVFQGDRNLARGCPTAGTLWLPQWGSGKLTDGITVSAHDGYWALHEKTSGWAEIDLSFAEPRPCSGVLADSVTIWNAHNSHYNDRGALELNLRLFYGGKEVWRKDGVAMPWAADTDSQLQVKLPEQRFDRLRIEIPRWQGQGGGLAEVQVHHGAANLAAGCPTTASGCYSFAFVPANIVDGITTSNTADVGYWLPPDNAVGWIEIDLSCNCPEIGKQNRDLGAYRALVEDDWSHGLPWLARSDLIDLRTLAIADERLWSLWSLWLWSTDAPQALAAVAVGDRWWELAQASAAPFKEKLLRHALYYYAGARRSLPQSEIERLDERLNQAAPLRDGTPLFLLHEAEVRRVFPNDNIRSAIYVRRAHYRWGFCMHPYANETASASFNLSKKYRRLVGATAIGDTSQGAAETPLNFKILADGRELWVSKPAQRGSAPERFDVDVSGAERLQLAVECPGGNGWCHAVWLDPVLDPSSSWRQPDGEARPMSEVAAAASDSPAPPQLDVTLAPGVTIKLVKIPASADGKIKSFYLGQTEVTQKQWVAVMGSNPASHRGDDLPIPQIDAPSCIEFCKKVSAANAPCQFRLPTEGEWAYAYGSAQQYTDDYTGTTWCELNSGGQTQPVGKLKPNQFGLYDMLGNVRERVGDGTIVLGNDYLTPKFDGKFDRQEIGALSYLFNSGFRVAADLREASTPTMPDKGALAGNTSVPSEANSPRPDQPRSPVLGNEPRLAAPEGEALKKARQDLQKKISTDVAAAKSAEAKRKLAEEFLHKARTAEKRDANVYATYDEAIELAETAGDLDLAWRAIDDLAGAFAIDAVARRQQSLTQVIKAAKSPAACHVLTADACRLLADALAAEDAALVKKAAAQAQSLSKRGKDTALAKAVTAYTRDAAKLAATIEAVAAARETLKTTPDDAAANFTVGYYEFCVAGDFERGLPKLAKAADDGWRKPAADDLDASRNEVTPQRQLAVADGWWSRAADESWPARHYLRLRAAVWFRRALTSLTGGERTRATDRVKEFLADDDGLPKWEMFRIDRGEKLPGGLRLNPEGSMFTCVEFDAPMEITLVARTDSLNIRLLVHGHEMIWNWEGNPRELVVQRPDGYEIKSPTVPLATHRWYTLRYRVERQGTLITVDGMPVFTERHDYGKFPLAAVGVGRFGPAVIDVKELVIRPLE